MTASMFVEAACYTVMRMWWAACLAKCLWEALIEQTDLRGAHSRADLPKQLHWCQAAQV